MDHLTMYTSPRLDEQTEEEQEEECIRISNDEEKYN